MTDINAPFVSPFVARIRFPNYNILQERFAKICETVTNATLFDLVPYFISSHVASAIVKLSVTIKILTMLAPHSKPSQTFWNEMHLK